MPILTLSPVPQPPITSLIVISLTLIAQLLATQIQFATVAESHASAINWMTVVNGITVAFVLLAGYYAGKSLKLIKAAGQQQQTTVT